METSILPVKRCKNYIFAWLLSPFSKDGYLSHYTRCNTGSAQSNHPMHLIIFHDTQGVLRTIVAVKKYEIDRDILCKSLVNDQIMVNDDNSYYTM